jgi:arylsulfatase
MPTQGTLTLHMGEEVVGEGRIKTQPGKFSIAGEGLNVGKEGAEPVTDDYPGGYPWVFIGGTIHKAMVDVSGTPFVDLASDARMAFARD